MAGEGCCTRQLRGKAVVGELVPAPCSREEPPLVLVPLVGMIEADTLLASGGACMPFVEVSMCSRPTGTSRCTIRSLDRRFVGTLAALPRGRRFADRTEALSDLFAGVLPAGLGRL